MAQQGSPITPNHDENKQSAAGVVAFGIDLGTTNSCIAAYYSNDRTEIIENGNGGFVTPSVVSFCHGDCIVGKAAVENMTRSPETTYSYIKRFIGKKKGDLNLERDMKTVTFPIILDYQIPGIDPPKIDERPRLPFQLAGYDIKEPLLPEHISAIVLKSLYKDAQKRIPKEIKDVIITVPANFNDYQRRATEDAGKIAGFNVLGVLSEPTAAAICYAKKATEMKMNEKIMVYDFGGGTLDVSILEINDFEFRVLATDGDTQCGGYDIDNQMFEIVKRELEKKGAVIKDKRAQAKIRESCEVTKKAISTGSLASYAITNDQNISVNFTKEMLNRICYNMKDRLIKPIAKTLEIIKDRYKIDKLSIDKVIGVGGSCSLPAVQKIVSDYMDKKMEMPVNPAEAIAMGAAIYASYKKDKNSIAGISKIKIKDVIPMAIGIGIINNKQRKVLRFIEKNEVRPNKSRKFNFLGHPGSNEVSIDVYEGDSDYQSECHLIESNKIRDPKKDEDGRPVLDIYIEVTKKSFTLKATSGDKEVTSEFMNKDNNSHSAEDYERMAKEVEELMRFHDNDDEEEEEEEVKPAVIFFRYISTPKGRKEITGGRKITLQRLNKVLKNYKEWATKNKKASQAEVDLKMEELKNEIKALK